MTTSKRKNQSKAKGADQKLHRLRPNGEPRPNSTDFTISLGAKGGTDLFLVNPGSEQGQFMRGFEETNVDIAVTKLWPTQCIRSTPSPIFVSMRMKLCGRGDDEVGFHTSHRTVIKGTNTGMSRFGLPTGRLIQMWGITQHEIKNGRITQEWFMFNKFAVMQQIFHD